MNQLVTISEITKKLKTQGSEPILVMASDLEYYYCKYPFHSGDPKLLNEYLGARFASIWGIEVPEIALVNVLREHVPEHVLGGRLTYHSLEIPTIGFKQLPEVLDLADKIVENFSASDIKKMDKSVFLNIALFDLWLANEDRTTNNNNLLMVNKQRVYTPIAIDHEKIFNSGDLRRPIEQLTYEDSILYSGLYHRLLKNSTVVHQLIDEISASLFVKAGFCETELDAILADVPSEWGYDIQVLRDKLHQNVFSDTWLNETLSTFKSFASLTLKNP